MRSIVARGAILLGEPMLSGLRPLPISTMACLVSHERATIMTRSEERRVGKECKSTRWTGDWSSDVCSSDLILYEYDSDQNLTRLRDENGSITNCNFDAINRRTGCDITRGTNVVGTTAVTHQYDGLSRLTRASDNNDQIGRASCRERV